MPRRCSIALRSAQRAWAACASGRASTSILGQSVFVVVLFSNDDDCASVQLAGQSERQLREWRVHGRRRVQDERHWRRLRATVHWRARLRQQCLHDPDVGDDLHAAVRQRSGVRQHRQVHHGRLLDAISDRLVSDQSGNVFQQRAKLFPHSFTRLRRVVVAVFVKRSTLATVRQPIRLALVAVRRLCHLRRLFISLSLSCLLKMVIRASRARVSRVL